MKTRLILYLVASWCALHLCAVFGATWHVRPGAGGSNNGTDWNNAFTSVPAALTRGDTYYIADGTYSSYIEFDDAVSGTTLITIKKATVADHGTSTGWLDSYGDGVANFDTWIFETGYYLMDGGGRISRRESGQGFKLTHVASDSLGMIGTGGQFASNLTFYDVEVTCNASAGPPYQTAVYLVNGGSSIYFGYCSFHDIPGDMWQIRQIAGLTVEHSYFARNWQDATRHGDVIESDQTSSNHIFRFNYIDACVGTYIFGHHTTGNVTGMEIYGNVFRATTTGNGIIATLNPGAGGTINNLRVYNNTFVNTTFNSGIHLYNGSSGSGATNNLYYNCESLSFSSVSHDYNWFRLSGTQSEANIQNGSGDPFMSIAGEDFRLSAATSAGTTLGSPYNTDPNAVTRAVDGVWDRGAFEYNSGAGSPPTAPSNLAAAAVSTTQINLTWDDNSSDEDEFKIEQSTIGGGSGFTQIATVGPGVESYSVTSLLPATTYYYRVRASNAFGNSAYTSEASATTDSPPDPPDPPPPGAPGGVALDTNYRRR